jgi:hypothetical protein
LNLHPPETGSHEEPTEETAPPIVTEAVYSTSPSSTNWTPSTES